MKGNNNMIKETYTSPERGRSATEKIRIEPKVVMILLVIAFFVLLALSSAWAEEKKSSFGGVRGIVRGMIIRNGRIIYKRIPGAKVSLEFTNFSATTDIDGRFIIAGIPPGKYRILVTTENFGSCARQIEVRPQKIFNTRSFVVLLEGNAAIPTIQPGSLVAAFSVRAIKEKTNSQIPKKRKDGNTAINGLVFYSPDTYKAYLEMVMENRPLSITYGKSEKELYVATLENGLELWDLESFEPVKRFNVPGMVSNLRWNKDRTKLYVSFVGGRKVGVIVIDSEKKEIINVIVPPPIGIIGGSFPVEEENVLLAIISRVKDGRLIKISLKDSAKPLVMRNRRIGNFPTALTYLPRQKLIMVTSHLGNAVVTLELETFKIRRKQVIKGMPSQIINGFKDSKAYVSIINTDHVIVLDGYRGAKIGQVSVGRRPFRMCKRVYLIFVANSMDRTISIIDGRIDRVIKTTPPEEYHYIVDLDILP